MRALPLLAVLVLAPLPDAIAQEQPLRLGQRVRVTAPEYGLQRTPATLLEVRSDTLHVLQVRTVNVVGGDVVQDSLTSAVPIAAITRLDVSLGHRSNLLRGLGIGLGVGAATGALIGLALEDNETGFVQGRTGVGMAIVMGLAAGGIAALAEARSTERWEEVRLDCLRVSIAPTGDGFGIGARIAF